MRFEVSGIYNWLAHISKIVQIQADVQHSQSERCLLSAYSGTLKDVKNFSKVNRLSFTALMLMGIMDNMVDWLLKQENYKRWVKTLKDYLYPLWKIFAQFRLKITISKWMEGFSINTKIHNDGSLYCYSRKHKRGYNNDFWFDLNNFGFLVNGIRKIIYIKTYWL